MSQPSDKPLCWIQNGSFEWIEDLIGTGSAQFGQVFVFANAPKANAIPLFTTPQKYEQCQAPDVYQSGLTEFQRNVLRRTSSWLGQNQVSDWAKDHFDVMYNLKKELDLVLAEQPSELSKDAPRAYQKPKLSAEQLDLIDTAKRQMRQAFESVDMTESEVLISVDDLRTWMKTIESLSSPESRVLPGFDVVGKGSSH
jgi:hypothetical protein